MVAFIMNYFPLFACLNDQPCLVVGGGEVAQRKVAQLLDAQARVTVNAPALCPALADWAAAGRIHVVRRGFDPALVPAALLVIAATDDPATNQAVAAAARAALKLCNVVDDPAESTFISPSIVNRAPVMVAVSSGGRAPVLARMVRQQIERLLPLRLADLADWAGRWRTTVRERLPDLRARRRFWERVFGGDLSQHVLAGRMDVADAALTAALAASGSAPKDRGEAWIVGAGPGDPELLTLRGFYLLQHADVVLHDRLAPPELLAYARRDAEIINVGKTGGGPSMEQAEINALLLDRVRAGRRVCRLKGGDPLIFGRGSEEAEALVAAGLPFQIVPGITAASGCGAYAGIPLTHRGRAHAVTLVSGRLGEGEPAAAEPASYEPDWATLATGDQTLVIYMAGRRLQAVADALHRHGRPADTPAAVVMAGTTRSQQVVTGTLATIGARVAAVGLRSPALLYVGPVVTLADTLRWYTPAEGSPDAYNKATATRPAPN